MSYLFYISWLQLAVEFMIITYEMIACFIYKIIKHLVTQSRSNNDLRMNYLLYDFMACSDKPFESDFAVILVAITGQIYEFILYLFYISWLLSMKWLPVLFIYASMMSVGWIFIHFELNFWCFLLVLMTDHISAETGKSEFI